MPQSLFLKTLQILAFVCSIFLLWKFSTSSPIAILDEWDSREFYSLGGIFLGAYALFWISRYYQLSNAVPVAILSALTLTHFSFPAVISVLVSAIVCLVIGRKITEGVDWARKDFPIQLVAGYAVIGAVLQICVHFPVNSAVAYFGAAFVALVIFRRQTKTLMVEIGNWLEAPFQQTGHWMPIAFGVALSVLAMAAFSETHSDALIANLRLAHQIQVNGKWSFDTDLYAWAAFPKVAAWLQMLHYVTAGEQGARLFNASVVICTALIIINEARRLGFNSRAWAVAALFLSAPLTFWCAFVMFDDAIFGIFVVAALVAAVNSLENSGQARGFIISLLFASAACATKITGLVFLPVLLFIYILHGIVSHDGFVRLYYLVSEKKYILIVLTLMGIAFLPYLYAYYQTGNPVFPLYNDIFRAEGYPATRFQDGRWNAPLSWGAIFQMTANTSTFMEGRNWTFGLQYGLFLLPIVIELFVRKKNKKLQLYSAAVLIFSILVINQLNYSRYLYPIIPIYCLLLASVLESWKYKFAEWMLGLFILFAVAINIINIKSLNMFYRFDLKPLAGGDTRRYVEYFEKSLNNVVNTEYGKYSKVLYLHRPYGAELDGIALNYHWGSPAVVEGVNNVRDISSAFAFLKKFEVTHIILDYEIAGSSPTAFSTSVPLLAQYKEQVGSSQLWEIDQKRFPLNSTLRLGSPGVKEYLLSGWRGIEHWGVWAYGDAAHLSMKVLDTKHSNDIRFNAFAMPYFPEGRIGQFTINIFVNGVSIQNFSFEPKMQQQEFGFLIPKEVIGKDGMLDIEFRFPKHYDNSQLQLGFSQISLSDR